MIRLAAGVELEAGTVALEPGLQGSGNLSSAGNLNSVGCPSPAAKVRQSVSRCVSDDNGLSMFTMLT